MQTVPFKRHRVAVIVVTVLVVAGGLPALPKLQREGQKKALLGDKPCVARSRGIDLAPGLSGARQIQVSAHQR